MPIAARWWRVAMRSVQSECLHVYLYRPQPTRRTRWKLVGNPGWQLVSN